MNKVSSGVSHVEVSSDREGQRLDNFLAARLKGVPRSVVYRIIRTGQVRVNGRRAKPSNRLMAGDSVRIPPATSRHQGSTDIPPSVLELLNRSVCFEQQGVMVIDKPAGMAVHSGSGLAWGVVDVVRKMRPEMAVDLAHRLDRETSGCLLLALQRNALAHLNSQIINNEIDKRYLCLLDGPLPSDVVNVDKPIARTERAGQRFMQVDQAGKPAQSSFKLLHQYGEFSFVEVQLHTGRTHQIRVHAAHLGLPLAGDKRYASSARQKFWKKRAVRRLFLHAHQLRFHTGDGHEQLVNSNLPEDLRTTLNGLE